MQPVDLTPEEFVSLTLRRCALSLDPRYGRLSVLAETFDFHESTLGVWIRNGRIPPKACRRLLKRFGKKQIDFEKLTQGA